MSLAWKIFLAFCLVLLVVLGLGLWSLQTARQLHELNRTLLTRAIPATELEVTLAELVPTLVRYEARAVILRDPAYQTLHQDRVGAFHDDLDRLAAVVDSLEAQVALRAVRHAWAAYLEQVEAERMALQRGRTTEARRRLEGPSAETAAALRTAIASLQTQSHEDVTRQIEAAGHLERWARTATLVSLALTLAVGGGLAAMVAVRIARPIRALSRATRGIAQGEYEVPLPITSRDEVGELARAFREMAQKLREVDTLKTELLANLSHDIRSPLTSIGAAASLLQTGHLGPRETRWLRVIQLDAQKILRLTRQILDLSRLRAGAFRLTVMPADLRQIVEAAVDELRPESEEKGVTLSVRLPDPTPAVVCDPDRIQQVLANLLSNAVKFTPKGGQIELAAREDGTEVILSVEDTGIGIPAGELSSLFERYHQAHRGKGGTGLGLAIVREFARANGGRVWVESEVEVGSRFHVALPRLGPRP